VCVVDQIADFLFGRKIPSMGDPFLLDILIKFARASGRQIGRPCAYTMSASAVLHLRMNYRGGDWLKGGSETEC